MDVNQTTRYSKDEIDGFKKIFSRPDTVLVLRNHFLQLELSADETAFIKSFTPDQVKLLGKYMAPGLSADVPLNQEATVYHHLAQFSQFTPDLLYLHIQANDIVAQYLKQQLSLLGATTEAPTLLLNDLPKELGVDQQEERVKKMIAFNMIVPIVEGRLSLIVGLINKKEETPEEAAAKAAADSSK